MKQEKWRVFRGVAGYVSWTLHVEHGDYNLLSETWKILIQENGFDSQFKYSAIFKFTL